MLKALNLKFLSIMCDTLPQAKIKKSEATFCRSALLLSFCENRLCLSQLLKKLNSTERGALFRHFCVSKVITTAHAHKSGVIFHFFPRAFKQKKIKALRPKMTKIASRGGSCLKHIKRYYIMHLRHASLGWFGKNKARRFSQFELKVGELGFPIHFLC